MKRHIPIPLMTLALAFLFIMASCNSETDKLIGTWSRSVDKDNVTFEETYKFQGKSDGYKVSYKYLPTDNIGVGYEINGTWEPVNNEQIKVYLDVATLEPVYNFTSPDSEMKEDISDYMKDLKKVISSQNDEMNYSAVKFTIKDNRLTLTSDEDSQYFEKQK